MFQPTLYPANQILFREVFGVQLLANTGDPRDTFEELAQSSVCLLVPSLCDLLVNLLFNRELYTAIGRDVHLNEVGPGYMFMISSKNDMNNPYDFVARLLTHIAFYDRHRLASRSIRRNRRLG